MKKNYYAVIVGGGASGILCAIRAACRYPDKKIAILERADRIGKKLLVTGNGRCNLSNRNASAKNYHGEGSEEIINILFEKYNPRVVTGFFENMGLMLRTEDDGRVYPLSNQASSVLDVLRAAIERLRIDVLTACEVENIKESASRYELACGSERFYTEKLVVAVGGRADYAGRESDTAGLYRTLGLKMNKRTPALSPVTVKSDVIKMLKGVRAVGKVTLLQNNTIIKEEHGEIQFADNALSGICVFNLSRTANIQDGCVIAVSLLPHLTREEIKQELLRRTANLATECAALMTGMFHKNIALALLKSSGIKPSAEISSLSESDIDRLSDTIHRWEFVCEKRSTYKSAQVTAGGVCLSEIIPSTFESKRHRGLYLIGEALDVDGDCGGYNLQFAFASGMCAGDSL